MCIRDRYYKKHKKLHKAQKGQSIAQSIHVTMRSPASFGILRWGNASEQKLEVEELRSPVSHYTLTTVYSAKNNCYVPCVYPRLTLRLSADTYAKGRCIGSIALTQQTCWKRHPVQQGYASWNVLFLEVVHHVVVNRRLLSWLRRRKLVCEWRA